MKDIAITLFVMVFLVMVAFTVGSWYGTYQTLEYNMSTLDCTPKGTVDD